MFGPSFAHWSAISQDKHAQRWWLMSSFLWHRGCHLWTQQSRCDLGQTGAGITFKWSKIHMDVGQNGRPRGPQMEMSSLVLTIQLLRYLILTHTHVSICSTIHKWKIMKPYIDLCQILLNYGLNALAKEQYLCVQESFCTHLATIKSTYIYIVYTISYI